MVAELVVLFESDTNLFLLYFSMLTRNGCIKFPEESIFGAPSVLAQECMMYRKIKRIFAFRLGTLKF